MSISKLFKMCREWIPVTWMWLYHLNSFVVCLVDVACHWSWSMGGSVVVWHCWCLLVFIVAVLLFDACHGTASCQCWKKNYLLNSSSRARMHVMNHNSHEPASSSTECSWDKPPFSFVLPTYLLTGNAKRYLLMPIQNIVSSSLHLLFIVMTSKRIQCQISG